LGSRIFDGIKRAWKWLTSVFTQGIEHAANWFANLGRLAYSFASNTFASVKTTLSKVKNAISLLFANQVTGSDVQHIVMSRSHSTDYNVYINPEADRQYLQTFISNLRQQTADFSAGIKLLGRLIDIIKTVMLISTGGLGVIMAMVKLSALL
jgi:hypothetical protein